MDRDFLIQLTNNLYRLTLLFPKKEPLRYKIRELADDILAGLISLSQENPGVRPLQNLQRSDPCEFDRGQTSGILEKLEILDSFFEVALVQNWVSLSDILAIKKEYDNLREELKKSKTKEKDKEKENTEDSHQQINQRQEKILEFLRENGRAQVWQVKQVLPDVSKRTLRRDFEYMLEQGTIERMGERNDTFYQIRNIQS